MWIDGDRANGLRGFLVENWFERRSAVDGLPHSAAGRTDVDREPPAFLYRRDRGYSAAHGRGTNVSRSQTGNGVRVEFGNLRWRGFRKDHRGAQHHRHGSETSSQFAHSGGFLSNRLESSELGCC